MAKIGEVLTSLESLIELNPDIEWTVRQMYYRLVSPPFQIFPNKRSSYVNFDKQLVRLREQGDIDDSIIVDTARTVSDGDWGITDSVDDFFMEKLESIEDEWEYFSRMRWAEQEYNVIVVLEKDALSRLVGKVTEEYRVTLAVGRGYSSRTQILQIYDALDDNKKNVLLLLGDFDPTGMDIERSLEERLESEGVPDNFELIRIALTYDQAKDLPSNPTKWADSRTPSYSAKYGNQCWELDAIPPKELQDMIEEAIKSYIDLDQLNDTIEEENEGRTELKNRFKETIQILKEHYDIGE